MKDSNFPFQRIFPMRHVKSAIIRRSYMLVSEPNLKIENNATGVLNNILDATQEQHGLPTIYEAMIVGERNIHHGANLDFSVHHHGSHLSGMHSHDGALGWVDNGRWEKAAVHTSCNSSRNLKCVIVHIRRQIKEIMKHKHSYAVAPCNSTGKQYTQNFWQTHHRRLCDAVLFPCMWTDFALNCTYPKPNVKQKVLLTRWNLPFEMVKVPPAMSSMLSWPLRAFSPSMPIDCPQKHRRQMLLDWR